MPVFSFLNSALKSKPQWLLCLECFKTQPWRLLNQTEMKIVRRKPNLSNPILAFLRRFETLEGYSVFHRRLSSAAHTHTHTNCYILPWLPVEAEKDFTQHSKKILLIPYNPEYLSLWLPRFGHFGLHTEFIFRYEWRKEWSCFEKLFHLISSTWQASLNSAQRRRAPVA